jgi:hypothetical protein
MQGFLCCRRPSVLASRGASQADARSVGGGVLFEAREPCRVRSIDDLAKLGDYVLACDLGVRVHLVTCAIVGTEMVMRVSIAYDATSSRGIAAMACADHGN